MFLALHPFEFIFLNASDLLEHLAMLPNLTLVTNCYFRNFLNYKLRKTFSKFYRRYYDLKYKFHVGLKSLKRQRLSVLWRQIVYTLKKIVDTTNISAQFIIRIYHYKRVVITLMYCNKLHAWWSTQSRLATLLSSLIARRLVGPKTL